MADLIGDACLFRAGWCIETLGEPTSLILSQGSLQWNPFHVMCLVALLTRNSIRAKLIIKSAKVGRRPNKRQRKSGGAEARSPDLFLYIKSPTLWRAEQNGKGTVAGRGSAFPAAIASPTGTPAPIGTLAPTTPGVSPEGSLGGSRSSAAAAPAPGPAAAAAAGGDADAEQFLGDGLQRVTDLELTLEEDGWSFRVVASRLLSPETESEEKATRPRAGTQAGSQLSPVKVGVETERNEDLSYERCCQCLVLSRDVDPLVLCDGAGCAFAVHVTHLAEADRAKVQGRGKWFCPTCRERGRAVR